MTANRISIDAKNVDQDLYNFWVDLKERNGNHNATALLKLLDIAKDFERYKNSKVGGNDTLNYINTLVGKQLELNTSTDKVHIVGSGKTESAVKYEQRAITDKWIMGASIAERNAGISNARAVSRKSAQQYIESKQLELDAHHQWLCEQANIDFLDKNVRNFNRRTGKASSAVAKLG